jgi:hypothetical protein
MLVTGRTLLGDKPVAGVSIYVFHTDIKGKYSARDGGYAFKNGPCKARPDCVLTQPVTVDPQGVAHITRDIQMVKK